MFNSYTQKNKYLNSSTTSFFTFQSDFEKMQSSTDLCVTVQLYTQVSACCWLGWFMVGDNKTKKKKNLLKLEASLAPAKAVVGLRLRLTNNMKNR